MTFFNIISFYVCASFLFCTMKEMAVSWITFNSIIILHTKMSPKTWEAGDTILTATAERNKKTSHPWKLKISGHKIDSCSVSFRISSHKLIELSCCPPPRKTRGDKFWGWWRDLLNWVLNLELVHRRLTEKQVRRRTPFSLLI